MADVMEGVLTKQHFDRIKQSQRDLHDMLPEIDRIERCGKPCADLREIVEHVLERLITFEREYFPSPPR